MWSSIHSKIFYDRASAQGANDSATVSAILLTAAAFDQSPPTSTAQALQTLRGVLAGTKGLEYVEKALHGI